MAASFIPKILKKPTLPSSPLRLLTCFNKTCFPNLPIPPFLRQNPNPNPDPIPIYPSFPHCFDLQPIFNHGFDGFDGGEMGSGDGEEGMWADSVKKKRKRKMNKHKLNKLRKRLRRKA